MNFNNNNITITTNDPENVSSGTENIECDYTGEEINIGFNGDYLKETSFGFFISMYLLTALRGQAMFKLKTHPNSCCKTLYAL